MIERYKTGCPDGGVCHHLCKDACFRVIYCSPVSNMFPDDDWPADVVAEAQSAEKMYFL